jgi:ankyrin repeat protein
LATIHRGDVWDYPKTRWPKIVCKLSCRVIDMVLEAALVRNNQEAMQLALRAGADPNISVWRLERSFNEKDCALSFAISQGYRHAAEMLLKAGASAEGTDFTSHNYPLDQLCAKDGMISRVRS